VSRCHGRTPEGITHHRGRLLGSDRMANQFPDKYFSADRSTQLLWDLCEGDELSFCPLNPRLGESWAGSSQRLLAAPSTVPSSFKNRFIRLKLVSGLWSNIFRHRWSSSALKFVPCKSYDGLVCVLVKARHWSELLEEVRTRSVRRQINQTGRICSNGAWEGWALRLPRLCRY
jgi:hypothetical protein